MGNLIAICIILWLFGGAIKNAIGLIVHIASVIVLIGLVAYVIGLLGYFLLFVVLPAVIVIAIVVAVCKRP